MPGRYVSRVWQYNPAANAPAKHRRACKYGAFVPARIADLPLTLDVTVAGVVSEAEAAIRELNSAAQPALAPLARLLLRTESIASSKIEGLQVGIRQLVRGEARIETGGGIGPNTHEVLANINAMVLAVSEAATAHPFGVSHVNAIHRCLMERSLNAERIAGKVRAEQNWIGGNDYNPCGADFVPPPPEEVPSLLDDLCDAINDDRLPPVVQAALVHAQFETIHPFADGNGRTGRALIHVVLKRRGTAPQYVPPISVVLASRRDRYIEGLTRFRGERVSDWVEQFAADARAAAALASACLSDIKELSASWRERLRAQPASPRADAAAWAVIDILPGYPVITAAIAASATGRSKPQIYAALEQLQACGVLVPVSESKRNRCWEAAGLLDLLEGLEAGRMPDSARSS